MEVQFVDRILICSDCHGEFIFTAGEQLFFHDKQFKNDPKHCKHCKSRRSGLAAGANGTGPPAAGLSRTETRTECSECRVQTTVPFRPTQGRPVLCRQCFQVKTKSAAAVAAQPANVPVAEAPALSHAETASALSAASTMADGATLSADAAVSAAASMAAASPQSSVASAADLASISLSNTVAPHSEATQVPSALLGVASGDVIPNDEMGAMIGAAEA